MDDIMNYEHFLELVKTRRSIRQFKSDPVSDCDIDKILEAARWAPSGFNMQPWEFVVVKDRELKDRIVEIVSQGHSTMAPMEAAREAWQGQGPMPKHKGPSSTPGFANAPVFILLLGDIRTRAGLPMIHRYNDASWNKTFLSSLASTFLYMHLAATSLGLASQWVSEVFQPRSHCLTKQLLGIPEPMMIYEMMALGYPDMQPPPKIPKGIEEMTHRDFCGEEDFKTDEEIRQFIFNIRNPKSAS
jgi:nitroreductase